MDNVLPSIPLPSDKVTIKEHTIAIRSLTRGEALKVKNDFTDDEKGAEIFIIACGVGITIEAATDWYESTDVLSVGELVNAIGTLTGGSTNPN